MKKKNPWLAGTLNFFFAGSGYIYLGRRKIFGYILITTIILTIIDRYMLNPPTPKSYVFLQIIISLILSSAFAYDAFSETKLYNQTIGGINVKGKTK